ncbi:MAG: DCC1-like thiol-disulfide oxidoreductase family protein, partial [Sediminibacterium sp.]
MNIILFDGVCNLCNGTVLFLIKHDKKNNLHF